MADALGVDPMALDRELECPATAGYITGEIRKMMSGGDPRPWFLMNPEVAERGARTIGSGPLTTRTTRSSTCLRGRLR